MKLKVAMGDVEVTVHGMDLTPRQVSALVTKVASIAVALGQVGEADEAKPTATGFTAHLDLDPERNLGEDLSEWFEEAP